MINSMKETSIYTTYLKWKNFDIERSLKKELDLLSDEEIKERFYKYLEFGTGGMRGELGVGTNRMNKYIIQRATQGLANYILAEGSNVKESGVVIAYDSRHYSKDFADEAALVLAYNGIVTYVFNELKPTPELSFAVRELGAIAGIVITASHNPPEYNGYKVYWSDGGQIPPVVANHLTEKINQVENELEVNKMTKEEAVQKGLYKIISEEIDVLYQEQLQNLVINPKVIHEMASDYKIVYTPLHGTGNKPVRDILKKVGFQQVLVVPEQEKPDPNFPTVKYPNPEEKESFDIAIRLAENKNADLILGTDPDTDRVGAVVKDDMGEYTTLTGNQIGGLLLEYLLSQKKIKGTVPENGVIIKTIVTSEIGRQIATRYGVETIDTLTGFKFIGEKIKEYQETKEKKFLFGYEESYGYLIGDFVRDKDAVQACLMISEMGAYYKSKGQTLYNALIRLFEKYGYYQEDLVSITLKGIEGQEKINKIITYFRKNPPEQINRQTVEVISDYLHGKTIKIITKEEDPTDLPKSNVLKYSLIDSSWFAIRPSGTEPKLKIYFGVKETNQLDANKKLDNLKKAVIDFINKI